MHAISVASWRCSEELQNKFSTLDDHYVRWLRLSNTIVDYDTRHTDGYILCLKSSNSIVRFTNNYKLQLYILLLIELFLKKIIIIGVTHNILISEDWKKHTFLRPDCYNTYTNIHIDSFVTIILKWRFTRPLKIVNN